MEVLEIFEKVKNISELVNSSKNESEMDSQIYNNSDDSEKFFNIINTIKLFKNLNDDNISEQKDYVQDTNAENQPSFEFNNPSINSISKVLPFLDFDYQKEVSFFIKVMEIKHFINSYKNIVSTASLDEKRNAKKRMIEAIKPKLAAEKQPFVDIFLKFLEINEIASKIKFKENYNEY